MYNKQVWSADFLRWVRLVKMLFSSCRWMQIKVRDIPSTLEIHLRTPTASIYVVFLSLRCIAHTLKVISADAMKRIGCQLLQSALKLLWKRFLESYKEMKKLHFVFIFGSVWWGMAKDRGGWKKVAIWQFWLERERTGGRSMRWQYLATRFFWVGVQRFFDWFFVLMTVCLSRYLERIF